MERHTVNIAGTTFVLAQGTNIDTTKNAVVQAVRAGGDLVDLVVFGNEKVSALVSPGVAVLFRSLTVDTDNRDTGDTDFPFAHFDSYDSLENL